MATNKILPFAVASNANIITDDQYEADTLRSSGNVPGLARSNINNKALKQATLMAAALAQFGVDNAEQDINDAMSASEVADALSQAILNMLSDRFTIIYPNGGSEPSPANITINQRYVMDNPFPGHYVACQVECFYNNMWGTIQFTQIYATSASNGVGTAVGQVDDSIIIQTGNGGLFGTASGTGTLFGNTTTGINTAPCRVKVWRVD